MNKLEEYMKEHYSQATAKIYLLDIKQYILYMGAKAEKAQYGDLINYIEKIRNKGLHANSIRRMLYGIKAYYNWLLKTKKRNNHPAKSIQIKDARVPDIQVQDLFSSKELEKLLERKERYQSSSIKNQVIISLLIYQALRSNEIVSLNIQDINLKKGSLYIRATRQTNERTLPLKASQILLFHQYIHQIRIKLIQTKTEKLLLNLRGYPINGDSIHYLIETFKLHFPGKPLTPQSIRQSVIANRLKAGEDLRKVQVFAGHKKISTTEKYRQTGLEELKSAILKNHPLSYEA